MERVLAHFNVVSHFDWRSQDKYRRSLADGENLRIRLTKQIQDAKVFGIQSFCRDLLEVADTLGHATNAVPKEEVVKNPHLKNLYDGLVLTQNSLSQVFKRHGLEQINPMKEKFNPNFHEALFQKVCLHRFASILWINNQKKIVDLCIYRNAVTLSPIPLLLWPKSAINCMIDA